MYTLAKPLGGGLPMGAILVSDRVAGALAPGDHATTFGGGPFVATIALDVVRTIAEPDFLAEIRAKGAWLEHRLNALAARSPRVREARGGGLMWGLELHEAAAPVVAAARERHLLVLTAGPTVIRIVPPLTVTRDELERGVTILDEVLA
jgi:acetylornithine/succinyldiaminopimelate/putrescine aminotransferase